MLLFFTLLFASSCKLDFLFLLSTKGVSYKEEDSSITKTNLLSFSDKPIKEIDTMIHDELLDLALLFNASGLIHDLTSYRFFYYLKRSRVTLHSLLLSKLKKQLNSLVFSEIIRTEHTTLFFYEIANLVNSFHNNLKRLNLTTKYLNEYRKLHPINLLFYQFYEKILFDKKPPLLGIYTNKLDIAKFRFPVEYHFIFLKKLRDLIHEHVLMLERKHDNILDNIPMNTDDLKKIPLIGIPREIFIQPDRLPLVTNQPYYRTDLVSRLTNLYKSTTFKSEEEALETQIYLVKLLELEIDISILFMIDDSFEWHPYLMEPRNFQTYMDSMP